ncbi:hypothetical protein MTR67_023024 [Solanum verrucosum]|uniref:Uncharacterized protein n=1 Tax=Solanum verrucosum TaxID=315347 RepID=A0AAF0QSR0_SOLVR|nr:hypothetical protein MTR67_023024 [Solanum verrucosum]
MHVPVPRPLPLLTELMNATKRARRRLWHSRTPSTDRRWTHGPSCRSMTEKFPRTQSENLAKSRLTDRPTVRRSDHGPRSVFVDRHFPYPASDTNYCRLARTVIQSTVRRSDRR